MHKPLRPHRMECHPIYGEKLSHQRKGELFGNERSDAYKGIVQRNGRVAWILVKTGAQQTYPNEVTTNCIKYCYSTTDGKANAAMRKAHETGDAFAVKVVADKSPDTYFWGEGKVSVPQEDHEHNGRMYRRFVIVRATSEELAEDGARAAAGEEPAVEEEPEPPAKRACIVKAPDPALRELELQGLQGLQGLQQLREVQGLQEGQEVQGLQQELKALQESVHGVEFDSHLERCHAVLMSQLHIPWSRTTPTIHGISLGNGRIVSYTPDFIVELDGRPCLLEIKPRYPYDDELRKATGACAQLKVMPLFLFYNTEFRAPFAELWAGSGQGDYRHHDGVRAIKFTWSFELKRVVVEHDAAYAADEIEGRVSGSIDVRRVLGDQRFHLPQLLEAYRRTAEFRSRNTSRV